MFSKVGRGRTGSNPYAPLATEQNFIQSNRYVRTAHPAYFILFKSSIILVYPLSFCEILSVSILIMVGVKIDESRPNIFFDGLTVIFETCFSEFSSE